MDFHDALDKLNGHNRKDDMRKLIDAFIACGRDSQSRLVFAEVDKERRVFRVAKRLQPTWYGASRKAEGSKVNVTLIPKQRQHLAYED